MAGEVRLSCLGYGVSVRDVPSAAEAGGAFSFYAGLRPSKPKSGLPGAPKDLLHPAVGYSNPKNG